LVFFHSSKVLTNRQIIIRRHYLHVEVDHRNSSDYFYNITKRLDLLGLWSAERRSARAWYGKKQGRIAGIFQLLWIAPTDREDLKAP